MTLAESFELSRAGGHVLRYCLYGPPDGVPVVSHSGSPGTRWKRPVLADAMERSGLRLLVYDRPGYGGSTRRPGRSVADAAQDVRALVEAQGWERFGLFGGSGGGPHALACAALMGEQVSRCAVLSAIRPPDPDTPPRVEATLREELPGVAGEILAAIEAGGPEIPGEPGPPARDDPEAMARLRATFVEGMDGWVDDRLAFALPWGFDLAQVRVPVGIWRGTDDPMVSADHAEHLLAHIAGATGHVYAGGHLPGAEVYREIFDWLRAG